MSNNYAYIHDKCKHCCENKKANANINNSIFDESSCLSEFMITICGCISLPFLCVIAPFSLAYQFVDNVIYNKKKRKEKEKLEKEIMLIRQKLEEYMNSPEFIAKEKERKEREERILKLIKSIDSQLFLLIDRGSHNEYVINKIKELSPELQKIIFKDMLLRWQCGLERIKYLQSKIENNIE